MSGIKDMLRKFCGKYEHWLIQEDGKVIDLFKSLTTIFECSPEEFFKKCNSYCRTGNDLNYYNMIKKYADSVVYPDFEYSNVYAIKNVVERIPSGSVLHLSINNSIRITNFFKLNPDVKVYANIGTHGIDGCMSSFLGQALINENMSFLVIGDLAFFYDMNALAMDYVGNNVRILLLNNHGGEEFYYNQVWKNEASDLHTTARHNTDAKNWAETCGFLYMPVKDKKSFCHALPKFMESKSEHPILMEVFTEMRNDSDIIYSFYDLNRPKDFRSEIIRNGKDLIKSTIGQERALKLVNRFKE